MNQCKWHEVFWNLDLWFTQKQISRVFMSTKFHKNVWYPILVWPIFLVLLIDVITRLFDVKSYPSPVQYGQGIGFPETWYVFISSYKYVLLQFASVIDLMNFSDYFFAPYLQGVRGQTVLFNLALRERNIQVRLYLKIVLKPGHVDSLIIRTNFQKSNLK